MGAPGSRHFMPRSRHAAASTTNMAGTNMAALAMATPPLLPACQASASSPLGTHSPSLTSASLQTSAVMVSSPSMPVAVGKRREGLAAMDAVACAHFRPSADRPPHRRCKISPQNVGPPPPQLGVGQHCVLKGSQTPGTAGKKPTAGRKHTFFFPLF